MKLLEGLLLLGAVVLFAWWQLRDVRLAREKTARERQKQTAEEAARPSDRTQ